MSNVSLPELVCLSLRLPALLGLEIGGRTLKGNHPFRAHICTIQSPELDFWILLAVSGVCSQMVGNSQIGWVPGGFPFNTCHAAQKFHSFSRFDASNRWFHHPEGLQHHTEGLVHQFEVSDFPREKDRKQSAVTNLESGMAPQERNPRPTVDIEFMHPPTNEHGTKQGVLADHVASKGTPRIVLC